MDVHTVLTGPCPRSEALVAATRDLDRGRARPEAVAHLYERAEADVTDLEARLGFDPLSGGYLAWDDLFRPVSEGWPGFSVGPITRWFETNTFYRQPILRAPPERTPGAVARRLPPVVAGTASRTKVTLPGPYTFAGLLDNRSGETREALTHRIGRLLAEELAELRAAGVAAFQFQEPLLVVAPPKGPLAEATIAAYRAIASTAGPHPTLVWTFFGDAAPVAELLARLPVSVVGVDLAETEPDALGAAWRGRALGLGCVDSGTTLAEDPEEIARIAADLAERLAPPSIWLGPGAPLDLLPYAAAARKLGVLPAAKARIEARGRGA